MRRNASTSSTLAAGVGIRACIGLLSVLALAGCVNTRVFTETELAEVSRGCGLAAGEVMQEPDHPRFLFLYAVETSQEQYRCVQRWARRNNMHLAYISGIEFTE